MEPDKQGVPLVHAGDMGGSDGCDKSSKKVDEYLNFSQMDKVADHISPRIRPWK